MNNQDIYNVLVGRKVFDNGTVRIYGPGGEELSHGNVLWRANPGALLMWPRNKQEGRSGYWRLFYTQLQEQALEAKEKPKQEAQFKEPYKLEKQADGSYLVKEPSAKPKKARIKEQPEPVIPTPFRPQPLSTQPDQAYWLLSTAWQITLELRTIVTQSNENALKWQQQAAAANDEEAIALLLLVA